MLNSSWDGRPFGHNRYVPKNGEVSAPFAESCLHLTQCGLGGGLIPWHLDPSSCLATTDGPKIGVCAHLREGELGPNLIRGGQGRGLLPGHVSSGSMQPFGHNTPTSERQQTTVRYHRANRFTNGLPKMRIRTKSNGLLPGLRPSWIHHFQRGQLSLGSLASSPVESTGRAPGTGLQGETSCKTGLGGPSEAEQFCLGLSDSEHCLQC